MLERYKEGVKERIEVKHEKGDDKNTRNKRRHEVIAEHFDQDFMLDKKTFSQYLRQHNLIDKKSEGMEKVQSIDFSKANPRNHYFMNELSFAGGAIVEGFLDCFHIERNKALENYKQQLQVIERKKEANKTEYFIGTFDNNKLLRLSPYQDSKDSLAEIVKEKEQIRQSQTENTFRNKENNLSLNRKREEDN